MSAVSPSPPSAAELENLSVLFIGFVAATALYGLTFFQSYIYYTRYPRDNPWIRYLVVVLCTLDTAITALVSEVLYYYLIIMFDVNMDVLYATTSFCVQYVFSVLLTFISQLFFAYRVFQVTGGSRPLTLVLVFLSFIALVFGLTASAQLFVERRVSAFGELHREVIAGIGLAASLTADVIAFVTMCLYLRRSRFPETPVPKGFISSFVRVVIGRGLAFAVPQAAYFCVFIASPSRLFWIPLQMVATKSYVNTLLAHLNARDNKRGQGINEEESLADRKSRSKGRFPASIRLNVTDGKATTQSVHFTTRRADTESDGTGIESRKTFQDEQGNIYTHVSAGTASTQSQTDGDADKQSLSVQIE